MDKWIPHHVAEAYTPPRAEDWTGRTTDPTKGPQYWYQCVELHSWSKSLHGQAANLIGYACEEGLARNQGRLGAAGGPAAIRHRLGKLAWHHGDKAVFDRGDLLCVNGDMEATQRQLGIMVEHCLRASIFPIVLGGGHDLAFGHYRGVRAAAGAHRVAIINFDAHFDLRPVVDKPNSGTPFLQALDHGCDEYCAIGIQRAANTAELFDIAADRGVTHIPLKQCQPHLLPAVLDKLIPIIKRNDWIYVSIDLDGFSAAYAPGVSAPSPLGLNPSFVLSVLEFLFASGKVVSADIAEMNPQYDQDERTARLGAALVDAMVGWIK
jgi:formiminoglutamase